MLCPYTLLLLRVVPSVSVGGVDAGDLGGLDAGCVGRVVDNAAACRGAVDVGAAAARSSAGGAAVFAAGTTMAALGRGVLAPADRHGYVSALSVGVSLGDGSPVVASDISVVPSVVSQGTGGFLQGSVASEGGGSPAAFEPVISGDVLVG